jgi:hypothetical protein
MLCGMSNERASSLFQPRVRDDVTPSRHGESTYRFLDRVGGAFWDQCRMLIDSWLANYPKPDLFGLLARFRSGDDRVFTSAFWELYLYEMYRRDGWTIELEPTVPSATTRPDFLVSKAGESYYVEARCTFEGSDRGASARLSDVYASLDSIDSGAFHLAVTTVQIGRGAPATRALRKDLESWLAQLDPDAGEFLLGGDDPERCFEWLQDGWHLVFHPMPRTKSARAYRVRRPLGVFMPAEAKFVDDISTLREALSEKGSKYGVLKYPLLLAINVGSGFHDDYDTVQALFGTVGYTFDPASVSDEAVPVLTEPGYWGSQDWPAHTHIAGILLAKGMHYGRVAECVPAFWSHPWAEKGVDPLPAWSVAQRGQDAAMYRAPVTPPNVYFDLPDNWPEGRRFP